MWKPVCVSQITIKKHKGTQKLRQKIKRT